ncbi:MAG: hypothetical protein IPO98_18730 [Saprospiraceae bacterium]|nr:hypothetical protein [Saprospiraceae bacterium]
MKTGSGKSKRWEKFKRWEWDMQFKIDPKTGFMPAKSAQEIYDQYIRTLPKSTRSTTSNWSSLGVTGLGRVNCIAFHPSDVNTYWIGAPSGGLWVTNNNGASWTCLTDKNAVLGVSDIIIPSDYNTSKTIYIATGERDAYDNSSVGVLRSTNGGATWTNTGLSFQLSSYAKVTRLLLDPNNNQILIAATTTGVFKTINGGASWSSLTTKVLLI